jgi:multidrug efflux pump
MLGVTFFGLFLTPVFYVLLRAAVKRKLTGRKQSEAIEGAAHV